MFNVIGKMMDEYYVQDYAVFNFSLYVLVI